MSTIATSRLTTTELRALLEAHEELRPLSVYGTLSSPRRSAND